MEQLDRIESALSELLNRVRGEVITKADVADWRTGNPTVDFVSQMMGVHRMQPTPARDAALNRSQAELDAWLDEVIPGNIAVGDLKAEDIAYFANMVVPYWQKTGGDLMWSGAVGGRRRDIQRVRNEGEWLRNNFPPDQYTGPLRPIIAAMMGE